MTATLFTSIQILVLLNPFAVLSTFLAMTPRWTERERRRLVLRATITVIIAGVTLFFGGSVIFSLFGINIDVFRIGGGAILFLSAIGLVNSNVLDKKQSEESGSGLTTEISKIAVVPLAIPVTVGPATIAPLMIASAEATTFSIQIYAFALLGATLILTGILMLSSWIEEKVGINVIIVLSKLTGLILAAMASQMIFTGIQSFFTKI